MSHPTKALIVVSFAAPKWNVQFWQYLNEFLGIEVSRGKKNCMFPVSSYEVCCPIIWQ